MNYFILTVLLCFLFIDFNLALDREKDCKCRLLSDKRIIGGNVAKKLDYRWQVSIALKDNSKNLTEEQRRSMPEKYKLGQHMCGGVILNERWILTAGHCLVASAPNMRIGLGTNDLVDMFDNNKYVDIEATYRHPNYMKKSRFDIALIKTATKINFTQFQQPGCVNFEKTDLYNGPLKLSGWGSINSFVMSRDPKKNMPVVISRFLKETVNYDVTDKSKLCNRGNAWENICVANEKTKSVACKGDSGGPLHSTDKSGKVSVIGLASYTDVLVKDGSTILCSGAGTAYTRISPFRDFVEQHIGQEYCN